MSPASVTAHDASIWDILRATSSAGHRGLVLFRSGEAVNAANAADHRLLHMDFSHTLRGLLSLTIVTRTTVLYDAVAFFTVLAHMPQLEELALSLVTFKPYDAVELPLPEFSLRRYSYHNAHIAMGMRNAPKVHDTISGWSLPLTVSAKTLRHLSLSLRHPDELEEALHGPSFERLEHLELRRNHTQHNSAELQEYARLVVRCPRLSHIAVTNIGDADLAHSAHLFIAAQAPLRSVELALSPMSNTRTWMHLLHDLADASVARVLQNAPALRGLRVCALSVPPAEHLPVDAMLPLTRGVCAAGRMELRLTVL